MKAIAGRLTETKKARLFGSVTYAGRHLREKGQPKGGIKLAKLVGYVPQIDEHIPTLTVRETLEFAHASTSKIPEKVLQEDGLRQQEINEMMVIDRLSSEIMMAQVPDPPPPPSQGGGKGRTAKHCLRDTNNHGTEMAMKVVRQARLELSGGSTPDLLSPPPGHVRHGRAGRAVWVRGLVLLIFFVQHLRDRLPNTLTVGTPPGGRRVGQRPPKSLRAANWSLPGPFNTFHPPPLRKIF